MRGCTALWDAMGKTISKICTAKNDTAVDYRVIITDGHENASREYTDGWGFLFIGSNKDCISEAERIGISTERVAFYIPDSVGIGNAWRFVSAVSTGYRKGE